ncbi:LacI family DNA-binding transcriptional regulator [Streptomyces sp. GTA36]
MAPTLTDVAKRANVALSTASRAFSDPQRLGPETLRKVLEVAQELGYEPPPPPRPAELPTDTATVAVVVPDIANPVFGAFVKAAQAQGWHRGQTIVLADTGLRSRPGAGSNHTAAGQVRRARRVLAPARRRGRSRALRRHAGRARQP